MIDILSIVVLIPPVLACLYYWILAIHAFMSQREDKFAANASTNSFAIIIPAHDEENVILKTIQSCLDLDYPKNKFNIYVIADNCTDKTAQIAKDSGVICYERFDNVNIGKGFALSWAFEKILSENHDCFLVIDADCTIDSHALKAFDHHVQNGEHILQANDVSSNPDDSPMSYAVAVGNIIENDLFYAPKSDLGLSVFLRGTGMVFHREILLRFPWTAYSVAEDVEYTLNLIRHDVKIKFVKEVKVRSAFPVTKEQLNIQRTRWASGNLKFAKTNAFKFLIEGGVKGNIKLIDAGFTFLVLSRPLVIVASFFACFIGSLNVFFEGSLTSFICFVISFATLVSLFAYFGLGILTLGLTKKRLKFLLYSPLVAFRLIVIAIINIFGVKNFLWTKTPRS